MTRNYFLDCVTTWGELIDLCNEEGCYICSDIIDDETLDEWVDENIHDSDISWRELAGYLNDIPTGYCYYRCNGSFDYDGMDDGDFESYKDDVCDWMDDHDRWEPEEDEEDEADLGGSEAPAEPPVEEEDFSVSELMSMCIAELVTIRQAVAQRIVAHEGELPF